MVRLVLAQALLLISAASAFSPSASSSRARPLLTKLSVGWTGDLDALDDDSDYYASDATSPAVESAVNMQSSESEVVGYSRTKLDFDDAFFGDSIDAETQAEYELPDFSKMGDMMKSVFDSVKSNIEK